MTESEREVNRELRALLNGEGLTSCFATNAKILAKRKCKACGVNLPASKAKFADGNGLYECSPCYWGFGKVIA